MDESTCPFCTPSAVSIFYAGAKVLGLWDAYPVNPGHALLVPKRHVMAWQEVTAEEKAELIACIQTTQDRIEREHKPDGYNIGLNLGTAAGQTVPHLHLHVIPRYLGDVVRPEGGVRHVIPERGFYGESSKEGAILARDRGPLDRAVGPLAAGAPALVTGGDDPFLPHLLGSLDLAARADIAVAFVLEGGLDLLEEHLRDLLLRGGSLRLLAGDYFDVTEPGALLRLLDLAVQHSGQVDLRVFETRAVAFHAKTYLFYAESGSGVAFVGSSNLSRSALTHGIEWNYRTVPARDALGFHEAVRRFEILFRHPATRPLTTDWVDAYRARRGKRPPPGVAAVEMPDAEIADVPSPHGVQQEALAALEATRRDGNSAGLVVLATGLGKTWLAAFDTARPEFRKVLFVAHREEILAQAMKTFRRIRPEAHLGLYTGQTKDPEAEVLFASVQTLSRAGHLRRFKADAFDYIIVDEFHHAAARTYRRFIDHFSPRFLLGLTATPERTDGGNLLALCQENLVFRRDVSAGIEQGLLCPFTYYGVPDEVDYEDIPWRSVRFDAEALTNAVATRSRAQNAFEQHQERGGRRTLAFCCSTRHANFMVNYFRERGIRARAVHSGANSDPRAQTLEMLGAGDLDVVFAVDMFNEGVDVPAIDTVMMLRPTESRILWLQQFGRGLRVAPESGKERLTVIDYIGNHRTFLLKPQTLLGIGPGDAAMREALERVAAGELELPPGCEVVYDLEALDILRALLPPRPPSEALRTYYLEFRDRHGARPLAIEAYHDGYNPRSARKLHGSWVDLVSQMGDLSDASLRVLEDPLAGPFLRTLEATPMTRSFKMLVLLGMLNLDALPGEASVGQLAGAVARIASRSSKLRPDFGEALQDPKRLEELLVKNPLKAWREGRGTGGTAYFVLEGRIFRSRFAAEGDARVALQEAIREIADWRLAEYLSRPANASDATDGFQCKVFQTSGRPILKLPERTKSSVIPQGWVTTIAGDEIYETNFVKIAVNVMRRPDSGENELPRLLREWFGPDAGQPGTQSYVSFTPIDDGLEMTPVKRQDEHGLLTIGQSYPRAKAAGALGHEFTRARWNQGFVSSEQDMVLLVTLDKAAMTQEHKYGDRFLRADYFEWKSQNRTTQASKHGQQIKRHEALGLPVHLFVRKTKSMEGRTAPFVYCGELRFDRWEGERPITVFWHLKTPLSDALWRLFGESDRGASE